MRAPQRILGFCSRAGADSLQRQQHAQLGVGRQVEEGIRSQGSRGGIGALLLGLAALSHCLAALRVGLSALRDCGVALEQRQDPQHQRDHQGDRDRR